MSEEFPEPQDQRAMILHARDASLRMAKAMAENLARENALLRNACQERLALVETLTATCHEIKANAERLDMRCEDLEARRAELETALYAARQRALYLPDSLREMIRVMLRTVFRKAGAFTGRMKYRRNRGERLRKHTPWITHHIKGLVSDIPAPGKGIDGLTKRI